MTGSTDDLFAADVAEALGDGWRAVLRDPHGHGAPVYRLYGPDLIVLHMTLTVERAIVRTFTPDEMTIRVNLRYRITAAISRGPARVAADITRRLLPQFLPALAEARARQAAHDAEQAEREALLQGLLVTLRPLGHAQLCGYTPDRLTAGRYGDPVTVDLAVSPPSSRWNEKVEVEVTRELLPALATAIAGLAAAAGCNHDPAALRDVVMDVCECGTVLHLPGGPAVLSRPGHLDAVLAGHDWTGRRTALITAAIIAHLDATVGVTDNNVEFAAELTPAIMRVLGHDPGAL